MSVPPHLVLRDVLPADEHASLLDWALSLERAVRPSILQTDGGVKQDIRNSLSVLEDTAPPRWHAMLKERFRSLAPQLIQALGVAPFELHDIEFDVVIYNDGSFYGPHIDVATGAARRKKAERVITAVYYLHAEPKGFTGGALRLHALLPGPDGVRPHVDIEPIQNGLAAFSATTLHEVLPVHCPSGEFRDSRFAINAWFRRARSG